MKNINRNNLIVNNKNEEIKKLKKVAIGVGAVAITSTLIGINALSELKEVRLENEINMVKVQALEAELNAIRNSKGNESGDIISQYEIRKRIQAESDKAEAKLEKEMEEASKKKEIIAEFDAELTAYYPDDSLMEGGFKTATGHDLEPLYYEGRRIIAMDEEVPMYSLVNITDEAGNVYECIVLDRGGRIKGDKIDIVHKDEESANKFGVQIGKAEIIRIGKGE